MPLVESNFSDNLELFLISDGFTGSELDTYCTFIARGIILTLVGASFATADTGSGSGSGVGEGTGLSGMIDTAVVNAMIAEGATKGFNLTGEAQTSYERTVEGITAELAFATLTSTHSPVFAGTGIVVAGSIPITASQISDAMYTAGTSLGFTGGSLRDFCDVIGAGIELGISQLTGSVIITGSGGTPSGATGSGSGTIS
jgi:hypothetical protein